MSVPAPVKGQGHENNSLFCPSLKQEIGDVVIERATVTSLQERISGGGYI